MSHYLNHLVELRTRLIHSLLALAVVFVALFSQADHLYTLIAAPLLEQLPNSSLIATSVTTPFMVPLKLSFVLAMIVVIPYVFFQAWSFVAPALYKHEKRWLTAIIITSSLLFYLGLAFAFFIIAPLALAFFVKAAPAGVTVMTDISNYLSFMLGIHFATGLAFQIPIITLMALKFDWVSTAGLKKNRPFVIVSAFILGMLLTPPDVVSQILLAVPMCLLFELGLIMHQLTSRRS